MAKSISLDNMTTGERVRLIRLLKHLDQTTVALMAKVTQGDVSRLERNLKIDEKNIQRILAVLDLLD
jgi:transcriptional regulator with XRE-family HTH domain